MKKKKNYEMVTTSNISPLIRETTTYISSAAMNLLNLDPILNDVQVPHNQHNQITFEVPSQHDLLHIENLHKHQQTQQQHQQHQQQSTNLNNLLERFGNVAYEAFAPKSVSVTSASGSEISSISNEQIAKSVVLNLHDLKGQSGSTQTENINVNVNGDLDWLERLFADADMHMIINYLWIGVVCALIILSLVFIMFSVYFYRKFRLWKQCNKDIRAQLSANGNLSNNNNMHINNNNNNNNGTTCESAYYQMMTQQQCAAPPPCYTIATGLPTYAEALNRQQPHYAFGMRFLYPAMTTKTPTTATTTTTTCIDTMTTKMQQQQQHEKLLPNNEATTMLPPSYSEALKLAFTLNVNQQQQQQQKCNENVGNLDGSSTTGDFVIDMA